MIDLCVEGMVRQVLLLGLCGGLLLTTACGDSDDSSDILIPGIPGDPPTVFLTGLPTTFPVGVPFDFSSASASVSAPSGLRTNDTFQVVFSGILSFTDSFDAAEVAGCSGGDTFCSASLDELLADPVIFDEPGTLTLTLTAFDVFGTSGSASFTTTIVE